MIDVIQTTEGALVAAAIYLLVGLGWNVVYNACGYLNLAIGGFYVLAAILAFELPDLLGLNTPIFASLVSLLLVAVIGALTELCSIRPLRRRGLRVLIVTAGLELILGEVNRRLAPEVVVRPSDFFAGDPLDLGGVLIARQEVVIVFTAALAFFALRWFFKRTDTGRTFRACTDDRGAARALGVDVARLETAAFVLGVALAATAGIVVSPLQGVAAGGGTMVAIKSFLAVSLGGIGNYTGALIGALAVAMTESFVARYWNADARDLIVLSALVLALVVTRVDADGTPRRRNRRIASAVVEPIR